MVRKDVSSLEGTQKKSFVLVVKDAFTFICVWITKAKSKILSFSDNVSKNITYTHLTTTSRREIICHLQILFQGDSLHNWQWFFYVLKKFMQIKYSKGFLRLHRFTFPKTVPEVYSRLETLYRLEPKKLLIWQMLIPIA